MVNIHPIKVQRLCHSWLPRADCLDQQLQHHVHQHPCFHQKEPALATQLQSIYRHWHLEALGTFQIQGEPQYLVLEHPSDQTLFCGAFSHISHSCDSCSDSCCVLGSCCGCSWDSGCGTSFCSGYDFCYNSYLCYDFGSCSCSCSDYNPMSELSLDLG